MTFQLLAENCVSSNVRFFSEVLTKWSKISPLPDNAQALKKILAQAAAEQQTLQGERDKKQTELTAGQNKNNFWSLAHQRSKKEAAELRQRIEHLEAENTAVQAENAKLQQDVRELRDGREGHGTDCDRPPRAGLSYLREDALDGLPGYFRSGIEAQIRECKPSLLRRILMIEG